MDENLPVYEKAYEFTLWLFPRAAKFPKQQRFVLGQDIEKSATRLLRNLMHAQRSTRKLTYLKKASDELDDLRLQIRLAKDLKYMSVTSYGHASREINKIGKMLGGWLNQVQGKK